MDSGVDPGQQRGSVHFGDKAGFGQFGETEGAVGYETDYVSPEGAWGCAGAAERLQQPDPPARDSRHLAQRGLPGMKIEEAQDPGCDDDVERPRTEWQGRGVGTDHHAFAARRRNAPAGPGHHGRVPVNAGIADPACQQARGEVGRPAADVEQPAGSDIADQDIEPAVPSHEPDCPVVARRGECPPSVGQPTTPAG